MPKSFGAAWALKRHYESPRPVAMIRYMGVKGQSSDPEGPSYHPDGLPLEPGVVEVITAETAAPGGGHLGVGNPGEIAVYSWPGEPAIPASQTSPVRSMRAVDWLPYQRKTFNTPAFPGYVSGHSTFSRAAAEVIGAVSLVNPHQPSPLGRREGQAFRSEFLLSVSRERRRPIPPSCSDPPVLALLFS
ncbi:MAG TPA: hypothetical protein VMN36_11750 [Verrucomicrobiales bacterium]|nr:hypothetical protein [Verrucomicrobiales bacterium]